MSLFQALPDQQGKGARPLADRMRPRTLDEFVGQEHIVGPGKPLRLQIERDDPGSIIFWGPPGTGKTTLAQIIAHVTKAEFIEFSAVLSGIKEIKQVMADAEKARAYGTRTILFIDEIHRFNRAQQDSFLPVMEDGTIVLVGATTENPSFELNAALLSRARVLVFRSRCRVYILNQLTEDQVVILLRRALEDQDRGMGKMNLRVADEVLQQIAPYTSGDARSAYNVLEVAAATAGDGGEITEQIIKDTLQKRVLLYDKSGEEHYNLISALHKSVRNSDADASLYWLVRMLESGEDPLYIARRVVRMASEDIGLAAPEALNLCLSAKDAIDFLGMPEGNLALAQAVVYLALAPKSNALYTAYGAAMEDVEKTAAESVPLHIRNAVTKLMKQVGYGKGYQYAHDLDEKVADMECMPDNLRGREYYHPTQEGREKLLGQRMEEIKQRKQELHRAEENDVSKKSKPTKRKNKEEQS
jgi:putative ATPase